VTLAPQARNLFIPATFLAIVFLMSQDHLLQETIRSIRSPLWTITMKGATLSGDFRLLLVVFGLLWVGGDLLPRRGSVQTAPAHNTLSWMGKWGMIGLFLTRVVVEISKALIGRERPYMIAPGIGDRGPLFFGPILDRDFASFPSGHAASTAVVAGLLSVAFPAAQPPLFFWTVLVGLSRVALNEHFVSDVVAGTILGYCMALTLKAWAVTPPTRAHTHPHQGN